MNQHENFSTGAEARRSLPSRPWSPGEGTRQDMLVRYLGAVAAAAAEHAEPVGQPSPPPVKTPPEPATGSGAPLVRDVMEVPAVSLHDDLRYREIARLLAREHVGALPVVDAQDRVVGVVSESDLLAKVAMEASGRRPRPVDRLRERRLHDKARGETAADLMTSPAITVLPGATVAEAAWLASLSRLKRIPNIGDITRTDYEAVTKLHPDLILGPTPGSRYDNSKGAMRTLSAVAPAATASPCTSTTSTAPPPSRPCPSASSASG